ncbi:MAG: cupin domain-containing protein [Burkholderiaceae bacterium]
MNVQTPLALLGGLSPEQFMRQYWQKKPLLIRAAVPGLSPLVARDALFALAANEAVESRLVEQKKGAWKFSHGPIGGVGTGEAKAVALPPLKRKDWTLLVQGVDLHHVGVHALLQQFRFVPDARLDDLMISYASVGGGVGPHFDSYDVFLLQASGRRRWRIGAQKDLSLRHDVPLKILANFQPTQEFDLGPGDMLYLPPRYAHDGVALDNDCQTYSIGFRAPSTEELARELMHRVADEIEDESLYTDRAQLATPKPAEIPTALADFATQAVTKALADKTLMQQILGEYLTEPKDKVWFKAGKAPKKWTTVKLDRASRMMYDEKHVYLNGDSWKVAGKDAKLLRKLADARTLSATEVGAASAQLQSALGQFMEQGWLHAE